MLKSGVLQATKDVPQTLDRGMHISLVQHFTSSAEARADLHTKFGTGTVPCTMGPKRKTYDWVVSGPQSAILNPPAKK